RIGACGLVAPGRIGGHGHLPSGLGNMVAGGAPAERPIDLSTTRLSAGVRLTPRLSAVLVGALVRRDRRGPQPSRLCRTRSPVRGGSAARKAAVGGSGPCRGRSRGEVREVAGDGPALVAGRLVQPPSGLVPRIVPGLHHDHPHPGLPRPCLGVVHQRPGRRRSASAPRSWGSSWTPGACIWWASSPHRPRTSPVTMCAPPYSNPPR